MQGITVHHYHHLDGDGEILVQLGKVATTLATLGEMIMATQAELTATLTAVLAQQTKTAQEIAAVQQSVTTLNNTIAALEAALAESGSVSAELEAAVAAVKVKAQEVDDLIPDLPAPNPEG